MLPELYLILKPDKTKLQVFGSRQKIAELGDFKSPLLGKELLPVPKWERFGHNIGQQPNLQ